MKQFISKWWMSRSTNQEKKSIELYKSGNPTAYNLWDIFKRVVGGKSLALSASIKNKKVYKWMTW